MTREANEWLLSLENSADEVVQTRRVVIEADLALKVLHHGSLYALDRVEPKARIAIYKEDESL